MKLRYNKRSTEWLKKGIPGKIENLELLLNGEHIALNENKDIEVKAGSNTIGAIVKITKGDIIHIAEKEFNINSDKQLHLLFANKNYKVQNMVINPLGLLLLVIAVFVGVLLPSIGIVMLLIGMVILTLMPNAYVYKKHGNDAFKVLLT